LITITPLAHKNPSVPDVLSQLLQSQGIDIFRLAKVDWLQTSGYIRAIPRDELFVVGNTIIESCFALEFCVDEVADSLGNLLSKLGADP